MVQRSNIYVPIGELQSKFAGKSVARQAKPLPDQCATSITDHYNILRNGFMKSVTA